MKSKWIIATLMFVLLLAFSGLQAQEKKTYTLDECVKIALEKNPQLVQSQLSLQISKKDVVAARANFLPRASIDLGYSHSAVGPSSELWIDPRTGIVVQTRPNEVESWNSSAGASISQTIFNGGYNYFNYKNSLHLRNSAGFDLEETRQIIIFTVKERYYNLLKAEKLLQVQEETEKSAEESYKLAEVKFEVGKAPKSELLDFKYQLENAKLNVINSQNDLSLAKTSLNQVMGIDMEVEIDVVDNLDISDIDVTYEEAMESSNKYHPLLLKGISDISASKATIGMATSSYMPSISAYAGYSWRHEKFSEIKNMFDLDYNWWMGVSLSIPIFQGFSRYAQLGRAKLYHKWNIEALDYTKRTIAFQLKEAYFQVQQYQKAIAVSKNAEQAAEEAFRLNREKYNLGAGTNLDLINAQVSYTQAKSNSIQALYDYKLAVARLQKAMGKLEK